MTIKKLIEKMENEMVSASGVFENWLNDIDRYKNLDVSFTCKSNCICERYKSLSGFVWGLYATHFITDNQREMLIDELESLTK
jgi:hypothetical protein